MLRLAIRGQQWAAKSALLEANLVKHRLQADLDSPSAERFATIAAQTALLGGSKSPDAFSRALLGELARVIPATTVAILPRLGHLAPEQQPEPVADALLAHRSTHRATPDRES